MLPETGLLLELLASATCRVPERPGQPVAWRDRQHMAGIGGPAGAPASRPGYRRENEATTKPATRSLATPP
jgi:hypothetical protein